MEQTIKIQSKSTDNIHEGTLNQLVKYVNNHPDCRAEDYNYMFRFNIYSSWKTVNFQDWLETQGYVFKFGTAIQGSK